MRTPIIAGNWKMYKTPREAAGLAREIIALLKKSARKDREVVLCPPAIDIPAVAAEIENSGIFLGAQNCHAEAEGAFTGEISLPMLMDAGVSHVIVGHSERRRDFREDDTLVNRKVLACLEAGLVPIVCLGESLEEREGNLVEKRVSGQLTGALEGVDAARVSDLVIAYEPVWAIGTGKTASPEQAQEVHALIRARLAGLFGENAAARVRIQYGGSVKPDNIACLMACPDIDGALVGGASLTAESFLSLVDC